MGELDEITILADDLTGALDAAAPFAARGLSTFVSSSGEMSALPESQVVSVNADTRRLELSEAVDRISDLTGKLASQGRQVNYAKIDSTLRGHPGAEITAVAREIGCQLIVVASAFPQLGRTVVNGQLLVHGTPLHETEVGQDPLSPLSSSNVAAILGINPDLPTIELSLNDVRSGHLGERFRDLEMAVHRRPSVLLCDSENDTDLELIVRAVIERAVDSESGPATLCAGSAGLASALAHSVQKDANNNANNNLGTAAPLLLVTASQRSLADAQIAALVEANIAESHTMRLRLGPDAGVSSYEFDSEAASYSLQRGANTVIRASLNGDLRDLTSTEVRNAADSITHTVGFQVAELVFSQKIGGLIVIGGDTAHAVLSAVEARGIFLAAEPLPGIALGVTSGGLLDSVPIATKAGAFGDEQTLVQLFDKLLSN